MNYELNLKTKAWGLAFSGPNLVLTAIGNRFNQFQYKETAVLENYEKLEDQEIQDFIDEFVSRAKVKRADAFLAIPRSEVHPFVSEFPKEAEESLSDTIEYQIEALYPGDPQEIDVFHQIIGREDLLKVQIYCIPKTYIGKVFGLIRKWGLHLAGITVEHLVLVNACSKIYRSQFKKKNLAILHFTPNEIEVLGLKEGHLSGVYYSQLEGELSEEKLGRTLEAAFSETRLDPYEVDDFILSGSATDAHVFLLKKLGIELTELKDTKDNVIPAQSLSGVGLSLTSIHEKVPCNLNILPVKLQKRHHQLPVLIGIVLLLAVAGWYMSREYKDYQALVAELDRYQSRNHKLEEQFQELTQVRNEFEERKEKVEAYKKYIHGDNLVLKVMGILAHELPDHSFLTSFAIRDGYKLTMQIETDDFFEVRNKLQKLPYFTNVDTANAISKARSGQKRKTNLKMEIVLEAFDE
ncbi:MAG: hypothetical protein CSA81_07515 [Acidobacteria bacterium]|nr:MAG: hypothetical protein CSA81_07515 [Acidobacteriota bacterium]PIE90071.1 MAG: hypothetical protein CR997_08065 [Acidobacteriota bacterium]